MVFNNSAHIIRTTVFSNVGGKSGDGSKWRKSVVLSFIRQNLNHIFYQGRRSCIIWYSTLLTQDLTVHSLNTLLHCFQRPYTFIKCLRRSLLNKVFRDHCTKNDVIHWGFLNKCEKSAGNCEFSQIYWRNPQWKTSYFLQRI